MSYYKLQNNDIFSEASSFKLKKDQEEEEVFVAIINK